MKPASILNTDHHAMAVDALVRCKAAYERPAVIYQTLIKRDPCDPITLRKLFPDVREDRWRNAVCRTSSTHPRRAYTHKSFRYLQSMGSFGFFTLENDVRYVTFRGSLTAQDIACVLKSKPRALGTEPSLCQPLVHGGVAQRFDAIIPTLDRILLDMFPESERLVFTGHSLGGMLAVLAAERYHADTCITFGSPPVGSRAFGQRFDHRVRTKDGTDDRTAVEPVALRIQHARDPIPTFPIVNHANLYHHVGRPVILNDTHQTGGGGAWGFHSCDGYMSALLSIKDGADDVDQ